MKTRTVANLVVVCIALLGVWLLASHFASDNPAYALTTESVVTQIQSLNRLETVAFSVDTVITSQKSGTWQRLWQDEQKALFVARGRVLAGVDLGKVMPKDVTLTQTQEGTHVAIRLPPSQILAVYLDDVQMYDWQTGLFGLAKADPNILNQAQIQGKQEVLNKACDGAIMAMAADNARTQLTQFLSLTGALVSLDIQVGDCQI